MIPQIPMLDPEQTRMATCDCGRRFVQHQISVAYLDALSAHRKHAAVAIAREIPELFVPVFCPGCESKQLGLEARRAAMHAAHWSDRVQESAA